MIRIKILSLKESDNLSDYYGESNIDMRLSDERPHDQLPSERPQIDVMVHDRRPTLAVPTNKGVDEEYELDEDLLFEDLIYEKKDRCYHLAKQKYDVFPSAYASGFIVRCRKGKVGKRKKKVNESVPQPGESSGKAKEFKSDSKPIKKLMSIDELVKKHPNIPYYKEVLSDYRQNDLSWPVTTKVLEYAKYLKNNPESVSNLPPIIFIDDNINDGAHRTSALWLLKNELDKDNPFWKNAKLKVEYYKNEDILSEGTFDKEKSQGLHGWFARKGGKGKSKGWVDCNTCRTNPKTGRKTCQTCGRGSGEKRSKYPACRPTPSACTRTGTSKKKSSQRVSWKPKKEE